MHRKVGFVLAAIAVLGMLSLPQPDLSPALKQIQLNYQSHLTGFAQSLSAYRVALEKGDEATIRQNHQNCRLAFKRAEYLLTHFDKSAVKAFLNGAPLPRIQQTGRQQIQVFEPEGLQILDEMVMESPLPQEQMLAKVKLIEEQFASLAAFEKQRSLEASRVMEAMQSQLVRIMALGITGFDTPGTLYGLPEAQASLLTMWEDFQEFEPHLHPKARSEFVRATALFQLAIADLKQTFADFDRMAFVRDRINPLYEALHKFQRAMGIDLFQGRHRRDLSINPAATNPFAEDFLNPYYYLELMPKIDTVALVRLGKFLFFDPVISHSEQMACASCHDPKRAFADGKPKSLDNRGHEVLRNSPGLINAVYADRYFYDLRADGLNTQIEDVIHNQKEFQTSSWTIANKLNRSAEYQELFQEAFPLQSGSQLINKYAVSAALGAYVQSLQAYNSPFDQYIRGETEAIAPEVVEGFNLFMGKANCGTCHFPPTFSGLVPPDFHENETEVLGVPTDRAGTQLDGDIGRRGNGWFTEKADHYRFSFKTVGLRNVALTAPYMHNGVFETLEEVLDFYNRGGGEGMDLAVPHQTLAPDSLGLSEQEQQAIIRFLEALTDTVGTSSYPRKLPVFDDGSQWSRLDRKLDN